MASHSFAPPPRPLLPSPDSHETRPRLLVHTFVPRPLQTTLPRHAPKHAYLNEMVQQVAGLHLGSQEPAQASSTAITSSLRKPRRHANRKKQTRHHTCTWVCCAPRHFRHVRLQVLSCHFGNYSNMVFPAHCPISVRCNRLLGSSGALSSSPVSQFPKFLATKNT